MTDHPTFDAGRDHAEHIMVIGETLLTIKQSNMDLRKSAREMLDSDLDDYRSQGEHITQTFLRGYILNGLSVLQMLGGQGSDINSTITVGSALWAAYQVYDEMGVTT